MKNTLETRLGIFFALALFVAVLVLEMVGAFDFFKGGFDIRAAFDNAQELKKGDLVKFAGVEIGRVKDITLTNNQALVTMKIQLQYADLIRTASEAAIKATGLMGQNFIAIKPGDPDSPKFDPEMNVMKAGEPTDFNALMEEAKKALTEVKTAAKSLSPDTLSNFLGPINDFVKQNSPMLTAMIANARAVSDKIAKGEGTLGKLVQDEAFYRAAYGTATNLQAASANLQGLMDEASGMVRDARQVLAQVNAGQGTLGRLAKDESLFMETTNAVTNLREILQKINRGHGSVGKLVNDDSLYRNAKLGLQKLEKATEGLEDQGPLSVLGIAINTLF